jgi:DeoR/GlpR family transcriptional regulator of sugar metabolism
MRVAKGLIDRRREELRGLIQSDGYLPVTEICRRLRISEATARRDLTAIEKNGHIGRTHGGALADYNSAFSSLVERSGRARSAKARIAVRAAARIPCSGTIFLDAGTTIQAVAKALARRRNLRRLVIATNSLAAASVLSGAQGIELHVFGGMFLTRQSALLGESGIRAMRTWEFDAAFLSAEGMDGSGLSNSHKSIADFQRAVLGQATEIYFCLDASKLGRTTPHRVTPWRRVTALITDASSKSLAAAGINLTPSKLLHS